MNEINGKTDIYALIGNPIGHSLSPFIHNYFAKHTKNNTAYVAFNVENDNLKDAIKGAQSLGIKGLNVTMPYKQDIMPLLYEIDESAVRINAVNTLKYTPNGYIGYNTDLFGFSKALEKHKADVSGKRVILLGAGGAAASAAFVMAEKKASEIIIVNKTLSNANKLANLLKKYYNISIRCQTYEDFKKEEAFMIVQTTSVGFSSLKEISPVSDICLFENIKFAFDLIYAPLETVFLKMAKSSGCKPINGIDTLIYQAAKAYEIWTDCKIDSECINYLSKTIKGGFL